MTNKLHTDHVLQLIDENKWDEILINKKTITQSFNFMPIIHHALNARKFSVIHKIISLDPNNIVLLEYSLFINLCKIKDFKTLLQLINVVDNNGKKYIISSSKDDSILLYFLYDAQISDIKKLFEYESMIDFTFLNGNDYPLSIFIKRSYNAIFTKEIKEILMFLIEKSRNFITTTCKHRFNIVIDSCLHGFNIDILNILHEEFPFVFGDYNYKHVTPLIISIKHKNIELFNYLTQSHIDNNADFLSSTSAMFYAITSNNNHFVEKLLEYDLDLDQYDTYRWIPAHYIFQKSCSLKLEFKRTILQKTKNINIRNTNGNTPLHIMCLNENYEDYKDILSKKLCDVFIKNKLNFSPMNYLKTNIINKKSNPFLEIVAKGFIFNLDSVTIKGKKISLNVKSKKLVQIATKCLKQENQNCVAEVSAKMLDIEHSSIHEINNIKQVPMNNSDKNDFNLFIARDMDYYVYIQYFINKYKITVPHLSTKYNNTFVSNKSSIGDAIKFYADIVDKYNNLNYKTIYWHDKNNYMIATGLDKAIMNMIDKSKIMFIHVLIIGSEFDHANGLIIDNTTKKIIHFEPYGYRDGKHDDFKSTMTKFFKKILPKYTYHGPNDYAGIKLFQALSNELEPLNVKHGDIGGFCLAWTLWFLELYIKNNKIKNVKKLISGATQNILDSKHSFVSYIRHYANDKRKYHVKYMIKIKYPAEKIFNKHITMGERDFLYSTINTDINEIISKIK